MTEDLVGLECFGLAHVATGLLSEKLGAATAPYFRSGRTARTTGLQVDKLENKDFSSVRSEVEIAAGDMTGWVEANCDVFTNTSAGICTHHQPAALTIVSSCRNWCVGRSGSLCVCLCLQHVEGNRMAVCCVVPCQLNALYQNSASLVRTLCVHPNLCC